MVNHEKGVGVGAKSREAKIAELEKKKQQIENKLKMEKAKITTQHRKDETRTKVLLGAYLLYDFNKLTPDELNTKLDDVMQFLTRDKDKAVVNKTVARLIGETEEQ